MENHRLNQNKNRISLIHQDRNIFICGSLKMRQANELLLTRSFVLMCACLCLSTTYSNPLAIEEEKKKKNNSTQIDLIDNCIRSWQIENEHGNIYT